MASKFHTVFVYGTLKKGEPNHYWFSKQSNGYYNYICDARTNEKYPLIIATKYNIPFVLYSPGIKLVRANFILLIIIISLIAAGKFFQVATNNSIVV